MNEFTRILVPTDFGEAASRALNLAVDVSRKFGGSLFLVHAYEVPVALAAPYPGLPPLPAGYLDSFREAAQARLDRALAELRKEFPEAVGVLRSGAPWEEILEVAKEKSATLIVMGTHGRRGLKHALLGSVAEKVVRLSPVPVLTVRAET